MNADDPSLGRPPHQPTPDDPLRDHPVPNELLAEGVLSDGGNTEGAEHVQAATTRRLLPDARRLRYLRDQARKAVSEPTADGTTGTSMLSSHEIDLRHARAVVDLAARIASAALGAGATAADSTALVLRVIQHFGISAHVDVTLTSVTITYFRSLEHDPVTVLRTVRAKTTDYRKLELVEELVDEITTDKIALTPAREQIARIMRTPQTYRRWVQTLSKALLGFWVAALFGGNISDCLIAATTTGLVDLATYGVDKLQAPSFFGQVAGAAVCGVASLLVMAGRAAPWVDITASPSLVVAAGMISMLAGLSMTTAARDAIDGYVITAAARLVEVATLTGGIVLGLTMTLWVGLELGVPAYLSPSTGVRPVWWMQVIASALIAVAFAINNHLTPRTWALSAFFGLLTWGVAGAVGQWIGAASATAGAAAFVAGLIAQALNRVVRVPTTALVTAGVVSLVPGMALYRGLLGLVQTSQGIAADPSSGMLLFEAVLVAVMLAAGASLGTITGRPLSMPSDWSTRVALAKAWRRGRSSESTR